MKWGLALSGGALRGAAHIGVLEVLEQNNLRPDYISGTSSGSLVAALYSLGIPPKEMSKLLEELSAKKLYDLNIGWSTLFTLFINGLLWLFNAPPGMYRSWPVSLLKGEKLLQWIDEITHQCRFYDTKIPLAIMATDINNGDAICFHSPGRQLNSARLSRKVTLRGDISLSLALRASTAIPGVFKPVEFDGRLLVDGGVVDNLPSEALRALGANRVIAINLGYAGQQKKDLDNGIEIASQALDIMSREITLFRGIKAADYCLNPKIYDVGLTDFDQLLRCVERGRQAAEQALLDIKALLS